MNWLEHFVLLLLFKVLQHRIIITETDIEDCQIVFVKVNSIQYIY